MSRNSKRLFLVVVGILTASMNLYFYVRSDDPINTAQASWLYELREEIVSRLPDVGEELIHVNK